MRQAVATPRGSLVQSVFISVCITKPVKQDLCEVALNAHTHTHESFPFKHTGTLVCPQQVYGGGSCPNQGLLNEAAAFSVWLMQTCLISLASLIIPNQSTANTRHAADASKH